MKENRHKCTSDDRVGYEASAGCTAAPLGAFRGIGMLPKQAAGRFSRM